MRDLPKTGEIWRHHTGANCLILGVLTSGDRSSDLTIVAYELTNNYYNRDTSIYEGAKQIPTTRYWRSIANFMGEITDAAGRKVCRFEREEEPNADEMVWQQFEEVMG
jgi:hypothetical protein